MSTHPTAAAGFGRAADAYERGRPSYPDAAVAYLAAELGLGPAGRVLDLAAGTGKLTRLLAEGGADVVAVEPVAAMRAVLAEAMPEITVLDGTAETIPLGPASVDAVTVAQAFHWFDAERARRDPPGAAPGRQACPDLERHGFEPRVGGRPQGARAGSARPGAAVQRVAVARRLRSSGLFTPLNERSFAFTHELSEDGLVDRVARRATSRRSRTRIETCWSARCARSWPTSPARCPAVPHRRLLLPRDVAARPGRTTLVNEMRAPTDGELVVSARAGSREAAAELFARHWPRAWRMARTVTGRRDMADDIAQDAFERAFAALSRFDERRPFEPWLHRIVVNRSLDLLRSERRLVGIDAVERIEGEWRDAASEDRELLQAVAGLSPQRRVVIVLRYGMGHTPAAIAELLGLPVGTIHSRLARGLEDLRGMEKERDVERA